MYMDALAPEDYAHITQPEATVVEEESSRGYLVVYGGACHNEGLASVRRR